MSNACSDKLVVTLEVDGQAVHVATVSDSAGIQIGRDSHSDIVVPDSHISRSHASIFWNGNEWHFASFGRNGSSLAGRRITHQTIRKDCVLTIGRPGIRLLCKFARTDRNPTETADTEEREIRGSISNVLDALQSGSKEAVEVLWVRCFATIVNLARHQLSGARKRVADEEDVATRVFENLVAGAAEGRFPELKDRDGLWRLIVVMTARQSADLVNREQRLKRGGGDVRGDSYITDKKTANFHGASGFDNFVSRQPTPETIASLRDESQRLLAELPDDEHREVALSRMEGHSSQETAALLGMSQRTVERRLKRIRDIWQRQLDKTDNESTAAEDS